MGPAAPIDTSGDPLERPPQGHRKNPSAGAIFPARFRVRTALPSSRGRGNDAPPEPEKPDAMDRSQSPAADDDRILVNAILAGEPGAFEELHRRYERRIFGFALKRLSDPHEAEDVTQEVFMQVHRCLGSFQGRSSLLTWMFGIAHNQVCRRFRRKSPSTVALDEPEAASLSTGELPPERQIDAQRVLARCEQVLASDVTDAQARVFHLHYVENRPLKQIAHQVGKSPQAVKISLFRTRRTLSRQAGDLQSVLSA